MARRIIRYGAAVWLMGLLALAIPHQAEAFSSSNHRTLADYSWSYTPDISGYYYYVYYSFSGYNFREAVKDYAVLADDPDWKDWMVTENKIGFQGDNHVWSHKNLAEGLLLRPDNTWSHCYGFPYTTGGHTYEGDHRLLAALKLLDWAIYWKWEHPEWAARYLGFGLHLIQDYFAHMDSNRFVPDDCDGHCTSYPNSMVDNYNWDVHFGNYATWYANSNGPFDMGDGSWMHYHSNKTDSWRFQAAEALGERYVKSFINDTLWYYLDGNTNASGAYSHYYGAYVPVDKISNFTLNPYCTETAWYYYGGYWYPYPVYGGSCGTTYYNGQWISWYHSTYRNPCWWDNYWRADWVPPSYEWAGFTDVNHDGYPD